MTRYRDLVRYLHRPPKGTSRKRRRQAQRLLDEIAFHVHKPLRKAVMDVMLYGESAVQVTWDPTPSVTPQ